jgi:hypothetical protein
MIGIDKDKHMMIGIENALQTQNMRVFGSTIAIMFFCQT